MRDGSWRWCLWRASGRCHECSPSARPGSCRPDGSSRLPLGVCRRDGAQVAGQHPPADVALPADEPVRAAARQPVIPSHAVDAPLNARPPAIAPSPSALSFAGPLGGTQGSGPRDDDRGDAPALRGLLDALGRQPTVPRHQPGRPPEARAVMLHRWQRVVTLGLLVSSHREARDEPTFDLIADHLAPERDRRAQRAPCDDPRVGVEQAEHLGQ
jgi:hypothetical protein